MNAKDLRAAAELIIGIHPIPEALLLGLASYILAHVHPDDDEPITREWLIERGGKASPTDHWELCFAGDGLTLAIWHPSESLTGKGCCQIYDEDIIYVPYPETRGEFRTLAKALKLELKE